MDSLMTVRSELQRALTDLRNDQFVSVEYVGA